MYVSDSTSAKLNAVFSEPLRFRPGFCGTYILLLAPERENERTIFDAIYGDLGAAAEQLYVVETRVDMYTIDNVIDLRLPDTQKWFFEHFKDGDGDFLVKTGGTAHSFYDLLPTLMHPTLGGCDVTHAIGSWMRSNGVNALVFPSARSDASVTIRDGELVDWHGWNLVDYRSAQDLPVVEKTSNAGGWPNFLQTGVAVEVAVDGQIAGSWRVTGVQTQYDGLADQIDGAGLLQSGTWSDNRRGRAMISLPETAQLAPPKTAPKSTLAGYVPWVERTASAKPAVQGGGAETGAGRKQPYDGELPRWVLYAALIPSASASHRRVEPSTSVNKNVTTPEGAAAAAADTPAECHTERGPTSHIAAIRPQMTTPGPR